jgi:hypothetical protein
MPVDAAVGVGNEANREDEEEIQSLVSREIETVLARQPRASGLPLICPTGKSVNWLSSLRWKNIPLRAYPKSTLYRLPSRLTEGRLAIVTDARRDAMDVGSAFDERR